MQIRQDMQIIQDMQIDINKWFDMPNWKETWSQTKSYQLKQWKGL